MSNSFYMYLSSSNTDNPNKAFAVNLVPFHSALLAQDDWKVAALHGKLSKTWSTIPDINFILQRKTEEDKELVIVVNIINQRLEKVSELTAKLREELSNVLKVHNETVDKWVKFGGQGPLARKIAVQPGVKITFSKSLQDLLGLPLQKYNNLEGDSVLNVSIALDYLNIKHYDVLYLMCKDTEGVYANNKVMGILTDITSDSNLVDVGESVEFSNKSSIYHHWTGGRKTKIQVYFANSNGEVLQINKGHSFVLLHFVKI